MCVLLNADKKQRVMVNNCCWISKIGFERWELFFHVTHETVGVKIETNIRCISAELIPMH